MKPIGIIKPLKISAGALKNKIRKNIGGRYGIVPLLSFPKMLYLGYAAKTDMWGMGKGSVNIALCKSELIYRLAPFSRDFSSYNANSKIRKLGYLSDSLFKSYAGLNRLTQALWSIYKSNNLQLRHSLLALIRTIKPILLAIAMKKLPLRSHALPKTFIP